MLSGLSLFTGIGGLDIALSEWVRPVAYCEIDTYAAGVLFSRMFDGAIPPGRIFPDVRKINAGNLGFEPDIIYGGFPCQDLSVAGARVGLDAERSGLFWQIVRLTDECRPAWVFLENVPGIKPYRAQVFAAFENLGYDCRDGTLAAGEIGCCHIRNRWWFLAHASSGRRDERIVCERREAAQERAGCPTSRCGDAGTAHAASQRRERAGSARNRRNGFKNEGRWPTEPSVCGANDVVPRRVDRIKCLGNSVVPDCAKEAFMRLIGLSSAALEAGQAKEDK